MYKILIIEDEKNIVELIQDTLRLGNYDTDYELDGEKGLKKANSCKYDLILLDVMLPKINGFDVIKNLINKNTPVIFLSAKNDVGSIVKGLKIGAQDYITKPFEPLELLARIELRLNKKIRNI